MDKIVKEVVKAVKEMPNGTRFTMAELLAKYGADVNNAEKMFEYNKQIFSQISSMVKLPKDQIGATVGLPYNIPLEKSKK